VDLKKLKEIIIAKNWIVFFIGFFIGMSDNFFGIPLSYLGGIIMLASFYLMYLKSKKNKKT
tara:strand:+ start:1069 stop:1251 length:183 start_codon:yes stop_codon:yes gene_type:complete